MSRRTSIIANSILLLWFSMGMLGVSFGGLVFVQAAWMEIDGIWMLIFISLFVLFCIKEKYWRYPLILFLLIWIIAQFRFHWYYTIFGATEERIASYYDYYSNTFFLIPASETRIIPDFWHMMLHLLLLFAFLSMVLYCVNASKNKRTK